ncbi:MAG: DUF2130 domain-containing protein [Nitrososphaeraceae archaeon]
MTIELIEYKCPACGHLIGEEEYLHVKTEFNKVIHAKVEERIDEISGEYEEKLYKKDLELQEQDKKHKDEIKTEVNKQVHLEIDKLLFEQNKKSKEEKEEMKQEFEQKLKQKEEEIENVKLQRDKTLDDKIEKALEDEKQRNREDKTGFLLKIDRLQKLNEELANKVEKQQQTLESIPSEFKGEVGEIMLCDELTKAFPQDKLTPKKIGVRMPDVIQNIVTNNGERISTPILWDMKTGENITPKDIEKAKMYKEKYNTDYCIIVSANGIKKNSKYCKTELLGKGDGVIIVHRKIAVVVAELTRNFLIEKTKLIISNDGRESKQTKLYDYITSSARFRRLQEKVKQKLKLVELQMEDEKQVKERWSDTKKIIDKLDELDKEDQDIIDSIIQAKECNNDQELDDDQARKDNEEEGY